MPKTAKLQKGISGRDFAVLVKWECRTAAVANLGEERLARVFNGVRNAFPGRTPEQVGRIVLGAVGDLHARAGRYYPHVSLTRHLFRLAYNRARAKRP
jgi:hypothetical protein